MDELRNLLGENEELNKIFDKALPTDEAACLLDSDYSLEEIESRYDRLYELKYSGKLIKKLLMEDHVLIEHLIEDTKDIPEYVHDKIFFHKKDSKFKNIPEKKGDKKKKDSGNEKVNYDSDASTKKTNKDQKENNKNDDWADINDSDSESIDSDVSTGTNESKVSKKDNRRGRKNKYRSTREHYNPQRGKFL